MDDLKYRIKSVMIEELMLETSVDEIRDDDPLFGPEGLGLDSVDALQFAVALDKHFGLKLSADEAAKKVLRSVSTIAEAIEANNAAST